MAGPNLVHRKTESADIVPPFFTIYIARPAGAGGWQAEEIDGRAQPVSMTEADGGDFSTLVLDIKLGADPEFPEIVPQVQADLVKWVQAGTRVRLVDTSSEPGVEWFVGYVGQQNTLIQGSPQAELYQLTVYGPEWLLAGKVITGPWFANSATDSKIIRRIADPGLVFANWAFIHRPCVFNVDNLPNMGKELWKIAPPDSILDDRAGGGAVFVPSDRRVVRGGAVVTEAQHWTAYRAVRSVVEAFDQYDVVSPDETDWLAIEATLGGVTIGEVDIDGMTVPEAIRAILGPVGYSFRLNVVNDALFGKFRHGLSVYPLKSNAAGKQPHLPPVDSDVTDAQGSRGEVSRVEFLRDSHNIRNDVLVLGSDEMVQVELTFRGDKANRDLHPAWSLHENSLADWFVGGVFNYTQVPTPEFFRAQYYTKGTDFQRHRDVWRTFVFNEDGSLDLEELGDDGIPDLRAFGLGDTLIKRPIRHQVTRSRITSEFIPAKITMEVFVDGLEWFQIDATPFFEILKDRAGIRLTKEFFSTSDDGKAIDAWRPFENIGNKGIVTQPTKDVKKLAYLTMLNNALNETGSNELVLKVRGSMASTDAWETRATRLPNSPLHLTRSRLVRAAAFEKRTIRDGDLGVKDARDDSDKVSAIAKAIQYADDAEVGNGSIMIHHLSRSYPPGTVIAQTAGRVLKFQLDSQRKGASPVVRRVTHHFGETNVTEVLLDSPLLRLT